MLFTKAQHRQNSKGSASQEFWQLAEMKSKTEADPFRLETVAEATGFPP
jgi:hypothetical protein